MIAAPAVLRGTYVKAQGGVLPRDIKITSVSWIDSKGLPDLRLKDGIKAFVKRDWPFRVMVGLVGTSNATPPKELTADFYKGDEFRALISYTLRRDGTLADQVLNPGFTPKLDKSKIPAILRAVVPSNSSSAPGEKSSLSGIVHSKRHPVSSLTIPPDAEVLSSALIKFRAGKETNKIGIEDALSPYHVPWVWCEHAVIRQGNTVSLIANGSRFPSHAWYVDDKRLELALQKPVTMSDKEPALSTGAPAGSAWPKADGDESNGAVTGHAYTVGATSPTQLTIPLSL